MLSQGLLAMSVRENVLGLYHCALSFGNWGPKGSSIDFLYFDRQKLDFGKTMLVKVDANKIFEGRISALEAEFGEGTPPQFGVLLEDRLQDLRMTRRTRTFNDLSDADVFRRIAQEYGLQPNVEIAGPTYRVLTQVNQSDLLFLRERARAVDAELWIDGTQMFARKRSARNGGTVTLTYGSDLREFSVMADLAGQRSAVRVNGWSVQSKDALTYEANEQAVNNELNGDTSGISILKTSFGERKEALAHMVPLTSQEAQAEAETVLRMTARRFVTGRGMTQGNAKVRVGTYVDLKGVGPLFSGKYYVTEVRHVFDGELGYVTYFTGERPGIARA
jgi:phage protein D